MRKLYAICFLLFFLSELKAQVVTPDAVSDSVPLYNNIQRFAKKNRLTYWMYKNLFIDPASSVPVLPKPMPPTSTQTKNAKKKADELEQYKGITIRYLEIVTLDPFGTSLNSYELTENNILKKAGNHLHIKTRRSTVKRYLLFKRGDKLDPLKLRESERILRSSGNIRDAKITVMPSSEVCDSVDVRIVVQDKWSISTYATVKPFKTNLELTDKNFLGLSHQFENEFHYDLADLKDYRINGNYTVPYIKNTFATLSAYYVFTPVTNVEGFSLVRPFYSPLALWAGGISGSRSKSTLTYSKPETEPVEVPLNVIRPDIWLGRGFPIRKGKTDIQRGTRLILFGRYYNTSYLKRPSRELDTLFSYPESDTYLASIGFSSQRFYKDKYIFKFGVSEDIPEGSVLALTAGYQKIELKQGLPYTSLKVGGGKYLKQFGYLSSTGEVGTFIKDGKAHNGALQFKTFYFTDAFSIGEWAMRQFIDYRITHGFMRDKVQLIDINGLNGLNGFYSTELRGTNKMVFNTQTVIYTPYKVLGFRFACFASAGFGVIGKSARSMINSRVFQAYGFGVLIRNEHLIFKTIQISFGVYPNIPEKDNPSFKYNSVRVQDFRYSNFFYNPPSIMTYQ